MVARAALEPRARDRPALPSAAGHRRRCPRPRRVPGNGTHGGGRRRQGDRLHAAHSAGPLREHGTADSPGNKGIAAGSGAGGHSPPSRYRRRRAHGARLGRRPSSWASAVTQRHALRAGRAAPSRRPGQDRGLLLQPAGRRLRAGADPPRATIVDRSAIPGHSAYGEGWGLDADHRRLAGWQLRPQRAKMGQQDVGRRMCPHPGQ